MVTCVFHLSAASGDVQTYQIRTAPTSTIAPGVVMASSPALPTQPAEEAARKREVRLMKNRHVPLDPFFFPDQLCIELECEAVRILIFLSHLKDGKQRNKSTSAMH